MLAARKKISSFHSANSWSNEIAATSSHSNTEPLERREVCLFQWKVWTKIIAGLEIVSNFVHYLKHYTTKIIKWKIYSGPNSRVKSLLLLPVLIW